MAATKTRMGQLWTDPAFLATIRKMPAKGAVAVTDGAHPLPSVSGKGLVGGVTAAPPTGNAVGDSADTQKVREAKLGSRLAALKDKYKSVVSDAGPDVAALQNQMKVVLTSINKREAAAGGNLDALEQLLAQPKFARGKSPQAGAPVASPAPLSAGPAAVGGQQKTSARAGIRKHEPQPPFLQAGTMSAGPASGDDSASSAIDESTYRANLSSIDARLQAALRGKPPNAAATKIHGEILRVYDLMQDAEGKGDFALADEHSGEMLGILGDYEKALVEFKNKTPAQQEAAKAAFLTKRYENQSFGADTFIDVINETPTDGAAKQIHGKLKNVYSQMAAAEKSGDYVAALKYLDEFRPLFVNYEKARGVPPGQQITKEPVKSPPDAGVNHGTGKSPVKVGQEIELVKKSISKPTEYGVVKLEVTIKAATTLMGGGSGAGSLPVGGSATQTSKINSKDGSRQRGVKAGISYEDIADREFWVFEFTNLSAGVKGEWSGSEISAYAIIKFNLKNAHFTAGVENKLILFKVKEGESPKLAAVEIKIDPVRFKVTVAGLETQFSAEFKGSYEWDWKKIGQKIIVDVAKDRLEKEAEKQGVKLLGRGVARGILSKLGPLIAAFDAGLLIGQLLNHFTASDEVASYVIDDFLGDFKDEYHQADTLGKMKLAAANSHKIAAAMVVAGVVGAAAGVGDLVLFKLLGLNRLPDYGEALKGFMEALKDIPKLVDVSDTWVGGLITLGIKFNPKYHTIANPSLAKLALAVYAQIKPIFKKGGDANAVLAVKVHDVDVAKADLRKIAELILQKKLSFDLMDLTKPPTKQLDEVIVAFLDLAIVGLRNFLEIHGLITYKMNTDKLGESAISQDLMNELYL